MGDQDVSGVLFKNSVLLEVRGSQQKHILYPDILGIHMHRLEVYCGKKAHLGGPNTIDDKSGPSAVIRNIEKVLPRRRSAYHVVVMDRFYTSVSLLVELLGRRIYGVGTVQTRRIGFPNVLKDKRKKRPKDTPRGSSSCARSRSVPELVAVRWWDSRPVFLLGTGSSLEERTTGTSIAGCFDCCWITETLCSSSFMG
jgi:hypothetical protein